jgi:hypothetical protein
MSGIVQAASKPARFSSIHNAQLKARKAWEYANTDQKLKHNFCWVDPPLTTKPPKSKQEWERLTPKEIQEKSLPFMARVMFDRECVLYCGKKKAFYTFFHSSNPTCDRTSRYWVVKNGSGFKNLEDHALRCYGTSYERTLANAQTRLRSRLEGASVLIDRTFLPLVRTMSQQSTHKWRCFSTKRQLDDR